MLDFAAHRKDKTVAFIAAFVLLLQSLLASWSFAASPHDMSLDAFGNPLCITSADHSPPPEAPVKAPNCCMLGCSGAAAAFIYAAPDALPIRRDVEEGSVAAVKYPPVLRLRPGDGPGNPRAPPLTA